MSEADEYGPGGNYESGPNTEYDRPEEKPQEQFVSIPVADFEELHDSLRKKQMSNLTLIEDATRWQVAYNRVCDEKAEIQEKLEQAERRVQALTDSLTYANDERGKLKRELAELQAYVHKQTEAWQR